MPIISAGLWQVKKAEALDMIPKDLDVGFNHIDASCVVYQNENELGDALSKFPRKSFFLTSKLDPFSFTADNAFPMSSEQLAKCLASHQVSTLDLVLVHWSPGNCAVIQETWRAMETFYKAGKARAIGVSNFCPSHLKCLMETATVPPSINQVLYHVGVGPKHPLQDAMDKFGVKLQAYSPLGAGTTGNPRTPELISGDLVTSIGAKYGKSGAQVSLRWLVQQEVPLACESTSKAHLSADLDIFDFELDANDMAALGAYQDGTAEAILGRCPKV